MVRVLVVASSADPRDSVLWRTILDQNPFIDLVIPALNKENGSPRFEHARAWPIAAIEPFGRGHSSLWIKGIREIAFSGRYDLVHLSMEPWSLIPQALCGKVPTVIHCAESVVSDAPWASRVRRVGLNRVLRKAAGVVAWGETSLDAFRRAGLPKGTPQSVIPMGIPDPELFTYTPADLHSSPFRVLYVGRLIPEKGLRTLVSAINQIGRPVEFRVLGEGDLSKEIKSDFTGTSNVKLILAGQASLEHVIEAMSWCHVVVVPSEPTPLWKEQWGRVAVEGMLSGRSIVVSDSGELPFLIREPGLIFPAGDSQALASVLIQLDQNRTSLATFGNSLYRAAARFSPEKISEELIEFWNRVALQIQNQ
jgi:glycosyltransferase involved in cell wall biosynthesis